MAVTVASFRAMFPAFNASSTFPDATVTAWITAAAGQLSPDAWGASLDLGTSLYVAHQLAVMQRDVVASASGGALGGGSGVLTSKSVRGVSATYDTSSSIYDGAGDYNLTIYGKQFWRMMMIVGMGGVQLGVNGGPADPNGGYVFTQTDGL